MEKKELFQQAKEIDLITLKKLRTVFSGSRRSVVTGQGLEFEEHRDYIPGQDDISRIDWLASQKDPSRTLLKEMDEKKRINIVLIVDLSRSMKNKEDLLLEVCATIGFSGINLGDNIGVVKFREDVEDTLHPKSGRNNWISVLENLWGSSIKDSTNLTKPLKTFHRLSLGTSMIFFLSDFPLDQLDEAFSSSCKALQYKHDFIPIYLYKNDEYKFPPEHRSVVKFEDSEKGYKMYFLNTNNNRETLKERKKKDVMKRKNFFRDLGLNCISVNSENYIERLISAFLARRVPR